MASIPEQLQGGDALAGLADVPTPALRLDLEAVRRNARTMADRALELGVDLRPHVKVHKCLELARLQLEHGARGITVATAAEAEAFVAGGIDDVFIANQVADPVGLRRVAAAARSARVSLSVDDPFQIRAAAQAAAAAGTCLGVMVELDVGMGRCGARSISDAVALAALTCSLGGLDLHGLTGYEGHCVDEPDRARRAAGVEAVGRILGQAADALAEAGLAVEAVSAGGTGTYDLIAAQPAVTEIQAGSYLVMDEYHAAITPEFEGALTVVSTVLARHGRRIVVDAGRKALGSDHAPSRLLGPAARLMFSHEEHSGFELTANASCEIGDRVLISPGYAPSAVNLHEVLWAVEPDREPLAWLVRARHR